MGCRMFRRLQLAVILFAALAVLFETMGQKVSAEIQQYNHTSRSITRFSRNLRLSKQNKLQEQQDKKLIDKLFDNFLETCFHVFHFENFKPIAKDLEKHMEIRSFVLFFQEPYFMTQEYVIKVFVSLPSKQHPHTFQACKNKSKMNDFVSVVTFECDPKIEYARYISIQFGSMPEGIQLCEIQLYPYDVVVCASTTDCLMLEMECKNSTTTRDDCYKGIPRCCKSQAELTTAASILNTTTTCKEPCEDGFSPDFRYGRIERLATGCYDDAAYTCIPNSTGDQEPVVFAVSLHYGFIVIFFVSAFYGLV